MHKIRHIFVSNIFYYFRYSLYKFRDPAHTNSGAHTLSYRLTKVSMHSAAIAFPFSQNKEISTITDPKSYNNMDSSLWLTRRTLHILFSITIPRSMNHGQISKQYPNIRGFDLPKTPGLLFDLRYLHSTPQNVETYNIFKKLTQGTPSKQFTFKREFHFSYCLLHVVFYILFVSYLHYIDFHWMIKISFPHASFHFRILRWHSQWAPKLKLIWR